MNNLEKDSHLPERVAPLESIFTSSPPSAKLRFTHRRMSAQNKPCVGLLALLVSLTFALAAHAQTSAPAQAPASAPVPSAAAQMPPQSSRVQTIQFESKLVGKTLPYMVLLPKEYDAPSAKATRYPVLYLLHGFGGGPANWFTSRMNLVRASESYPFILVAVTGNAGWYTDSASVATDKYETSFIEEVLPDVQRRFRTIEAREGRGVVGLSMGGYGALKFGVKHPEVFAFAGSMSGALNIAELDEAALGRFPPILASVKQTFGPLNSTTRASNDLFKLVREMPAGRVATLPFLYLDCGTEDLFRLLPVNRLMSDLLIERGIPHEYRERPGDHNMAYWGHQTPDLLRVAAENLKLPSATPQTLSPQEKKE